MMAVDRWTLTVAVARPRTVSVARPRTVAIARPRAILSGREVRAGLTARQRESNREAAAEQQRCGKHASDRNASNAKAGAR